MVDSTVVLNLRKKHLISINGKKKGSKNTGRRRKVQVTKAVFKGLHRFVFFTAEGLPSVLKHNRVSEVFKGFKVHDFEYYGQRNYILKLNFNLDL